MLLFKVLVYSSSLSRRNDITFSRLYVGSVAMSTNDLLIASQSLNGWPSTDRLLDPVDLKLLTAAHRSLVSRALVSCRMSDLSRPQATKFLGKYVGLLNFTFAK